MTKSYMKIDEENNIIVSYIIDEEPYENENILRYTSNANYRKYIVRQKNKIMIGFLEENDYQFYQISNLEILKSVDKILDLIILFLKNNPDYFSIIKYSKSENRDQVIDFLKTIKVQADFTHERYLPRFQAATVKTVAKSLEIVSKKYILEKQKVISIIGNHTYENLLYLNKYYKDFYNQDIFSDKNSISYKKMRTFSHNRINDRHIWDTIKKYPWFFKRILYWNTFINQDRIFKNLISTKNKNLTLPFYAFLNQMEIEKDYSSFNCSSDKIIEYLINNYYFNLLNEEEIEKINKFGINHLGIKYSEQMEFVKINELILASIIPSSWIPNQKEQIDSFVELANILNLEWISNKEEVFELLENTKGDFVNLFKKYNINSDKMIETNDLFQTIKHDLIYKALYSIGENISSTNDEEIFFIAKKLLGNKLRLNKVLEKTDIFHRTNGLFSYGKFRYQHRQKNWIPLTQNYKQGEYELVCINNIVDLVKEGEVMRNCVSTRYSSCLNGVAHIYSLRQKTKTIATIDIRYLNDKFYIFEIKSESNSQTSLSDKKIVDNFIDKINNKSIPINEKSLSQIEIYDKLEDFEYLKTILPLYRNIIDKKFTQLSCEDFVFEIYDILQNYRNSKNNLVQEKKMIL